LTVHTRLGEDAEALQDDDGDASAAKSTASAATSKDALGETFLKGLLDKIYTQSSSPRKTKRDDEDEADSKKRPREYLSQVAQQLSQAVKENSTHVEEECPVCLEYPALEQAVITPCAHIFCRDCLLGYLRKGTTGAFVKAADGDCPICHEPVVAKRIIALSKSKQGDTTTRYLTDTCSTKAREFAVRDTQEGNPHAVARQILEQAVSSCESSKIRAIFDELHIVWKDDPGSKVLIFSQFLGFLDLLGKQLSSKGIPYFRLDGTLSLKERVRVLEAFQSKQRRSLVEQEQCGTVLLMSMNAGAEGLNLTAASVCFLADPWWNAAKEEQCINRVHRIGQTKPVKVRKFVVRDSVEERIVELASRKTYVASEIYSQNDGGVVTRPGLEEFKLILGTK
jgi:SNF2 family DNA or RNA helicase